MSSVVISGDTSGTITLQAPAVSGSSVLTLPATTATLATLTTPSFASTIGVGGTTASASGAGISFPATQSASSDANTLDDYEEGTFTPTAYGSTTAGTTTYTLQRGGYTKIGRQVTVTMGVDYSALTGTGELRFGGLPFTSANDSTEYTGAIITSSLNWTTGSAIGIYLGANSSFCAIFNIGDDIGWGSQQCVNETAAARMTFTYFV